MWVATCGLKNAAGHGDFRENKETVLAAKATHWFETDEESFKDSPMRPHGTV
jgi:hypothetical protein